MKRALLELLPRIAADPEVGCVLLTGAGQAFCAGADTHAMQAEGRPLTPEQRKRIVWRDHQIPLLLHELPQPTLAAIPGAAAGAGMALALACNMRIAAESAFFTTGYARLALPGDYGSSWFLARLVGPSRASELMFTGERVDARSAERLGLVNRVVPDAELEAAALALARSIASGAPIALRWMKDNLERALFCDLASSLALEAERACDSAQTEDYTEALAALRERRAPRFKGR
jgi:enoyl-CoA hydratase/carnithine racemase